MEPGLVRPAENTGTSRLLRTCHGRSILQLLSFSCCLYPLPSQAAGPMRTRLSADLRPHHMYDVMLSTM